MVVTSPSNKRARGHGGSSVAPRSTLKSLEALISGGGLEALIEFLDSDSAPPESMSVPALDGFLTGIAIGPEIILPSEWLPLVWGGDEPVFADTDEAKAVLAGIMNRYNQIIGQATDGGCEPIVWTTEDGTIIAGPWASGFRLSISLRADAWEPLLNAKENAMFLLPIIVLDADNTGLWPPEMDAEILEEMIGLAPDMLPGCITGIAEFWRANRPPRGQGIRVDRVPGAVRIGRKVGRNESCPCGSGLKFKRCCGRSNASPH